MNRVQYCICYLLLIVTIFRLWLSSVRCTLYSGGDPIEFLAATGLAMLQRVVKEWTWYKGIVDVAETRVTNANMSTDLASHDNERERCAVLRQP